MKSLDNLYKRAEREIELIEQDDLMTDEEKRKAIKEIYQELHEAEREFNLTKLKEMKDDYPQLAEIEELISKIKLSIKECNTAEKKAAKTTRYTDAIKLTGMVDAYKKILWDLEKIKFDVIHLQQPVIKSEGNNKKERINEGQEKGNNRIIITPRPNVQPAQQPAKTK